MAQSDGDWKCEYNSVDSCEKGIVMKHINSDGQLRNNTITDCTDAGIVMDPWTDGGNSFDIIYNKINNTGIGIDYSGGSQPVDDISYNWITGCSEYGIIVSKSCDVTHNGIWDCDTGIEDAHVSGTVNILFNSISGCENGSHTDEKGIANADDGTTVIKNNISYNNGTGIFSEPGKNTPVADYNCVNSNTTDYQPPALEGNHDISTNPRFNDVRSLTGRTTGSFIFGRIHPNPALD